jgi:hypothetical protein
MTFIFSLASATAVVFLWSRHFWIFIAIIPYVLAYFSYRGSVVAAGHYGSALDTLINLDRFDLYKQLHLRLPDETAAEREINKKLTRLFGYDPGAIVGYEHPTVDEKQLRVAALPHLGLDFGMSPGEGNRPANTGRAALAIGPDYKDLVKAEL